MHLADQSNSTTAPGARPPGGLIAANDNGDAPERDRWRLVINGLKRIHMPMAVCAAQCKLRGMSVDEFARRIRLCEAHAIALGEL